MTDQELRVKVAEAMGWKSKLVPATQDGPDNPYGEFQHTWWSNPHGAYKPLPNYPASLDACAEFERTLTDATGKAYFAALDVVCGHQQYLYKLITASPRNRCLAFLATVKPESHD